MYKQQSFLKLDIQHFGMRCFQGISSGLISRPQLVCPQQRAGCSLAPQAVKSEAAVNPERSCRLSQALLPVAWLLHTSSRDQASLSLPLFLSLCFCVSITWTLPLSFTLSVLPPTSFLSLFLYLTWSKFCLPALAPSPPQFAVYCGSTAPPCGPTGASQVASETSRAVRLLQSALSGSLLGHVPELADVGLFLFSSQMMRQSVCFNQSSPQEEKLIYSSLALR